MRQKLPYNEEKHSVANRSDTTILRIVTLWPPQICTENSQKISQRRSIKTLSKHAHV